MNAATTPFIFPKPPAFKRMAVKYWLSLTSALVLLAGLAAPAVQAQTNPAPALAPIPYSDWDEQTAFAFIVAELAAKDGVYGQAAQILWPHARELKHPELLRRVATWAAQANQGGLALEAAYAWEAVGADDELASQTVDYFLIFQQAYPAFAQRLGTRYRDSVKLTEKSALAYLRLANVAPVPQAAQQVYSALVQAVEPGASKDNAVQWLLALLAQKAQLPEAQARHTLAAANAYPANAEAIFSLLASDRTKALAAAQQWTSSAERAGSQDLMPWRVLGNVLSRIKRPIDAAKALDKAVQLAPDNTLLKLESAEQWRAASQGGKARELLLSAFAQKGKITSPQVAALLAEQLEEDYHPNLALEAYDLAGHLSRSSNPPDASLLTTLAQRKLVIRAKAGDADSLQALLNAAKFPPSNLADAVQTEKNLFLVASVLRDLGQGARAVSLLEASSSVKGRDYELALAYDAAGRPGDAERIYRALLKAVPQAPNLLNALGYSLVDRNPNPAALAEGLALLEKAYAAAPGSAAIADSLGWAYFRNGQAAQALPLLQLAYALKRDPEVAAHLGELLFSQGQPAQAKVIWAEALSIDPKHPVLKQTLLRLRVVMP